MSNAFGKAKDTYDLVKKARALQKELKDTEIEASNNAETITVVFNGEQRMTEIDIHESWLDPAKKTQLEKELINVIGQAISKAQGLAAEKMKSIAGDLNLPAGLR